MYIIKQYDGFNVLIFSILFLSYTVLSGVTTVHSNDNWENL